jgi:hypothetical protein
MTIYDANNVPVLRVPGQKLGLSDEAHSAVEKAHNAAQKAIEDAGDREQLTAAYDKHYLLGEFVLIHNKDMLGTGEEGRTPISIGASTLDEALKECIGVFDAHVGPENQSADHLHTPDWVASTHKPLARALADYYSCEVRDLSEALA